MNLSEESINYIAEITLFRKWSDVQSAKEFHLRWIAQQSKFHPFQLELWNYEIRKTIKLAAFILQYTH